MVASTIEPMIMSDHAPITLSHSVSTQSPQKRWWRLNESILQTQLQAELSTLNQIAHTILDRYQSGKPIMLYQGIYEQTWL